MLSSLAADLLTRCTFPGRGEPIDCAVSGGPDSLALLALAVAAGCEATAYHVDHGLRPGSGAESELVAGACERLGARFVALRVECVPGPNLEARARAARRAALPVDAATGHTADDQAETMVLNLLRGAGLDGLAGMRPGPRHPILELRRSETAALTESLRLDVLRDPMNDDPAYRRNRVRHELLPLAEKIAERDLVEVLVRQAAVLADEANLLDELAAGVDPTDAAALRGAPVPLARRAVRRLLRSLDDETYPPPAAAVERVLAVARCEVRACQVPGGHTIRRSRGRLVIE